MEVISFLVGLWFSGLVIQGDGPTSVEYNDLLGKELSPGLVDTLTERALGWCSERGFPLAKARVISAETQGDSVTITLMVERGPLVIPRDISLSGTKASSGLRRCFSGVLGLPYSPQRTKEALSIAESFGFGEMEVVGFSLQEKGFVMVLRSGSSSSVTLLGSGAYDPSSGEAFGFLELSAPNIAGSGRGARVSWERFSLLNQSISGSYREPWIFGAPIWLELGGGYAFAESLYMSTEIYYKAAYRLSGETELWAGQSWREGRELPEGKNQRGFFVIAGGTWSGLRPRIFPERGFLLSADSRLSPSMQRVSWEGSLRIPFSFLTTGVSARGGLLQAQEAALVSDLFQIGGPHPPRGYRPQRFFVEDYGVLSLDAGLIGPLSPFGFLDWCPEPHLPSPFSYGGGLRLRGKSLGLEAVYARSASPGENGLFHISVAGTF